MRTLHQLTFLLAASLFLIVCFNNGIISNTISHISIPLNNALIQGRSDVGRPIQGTEKSCGSILGCGHVVCLIYNMDNVSTLIIYPNVVNGTCPNTTYGFMQAFSKNKPILSMTGYFVIIISSIFLGILWMCFFRKKQFPIYLVFALSMSGCLSFIIFVIVPSMNNDLLVFNGIYIGVTTMSILIIFLFLCIVEYFHCIHAYKDENIK